MINNYIIYTNKTHYTINYTDFKKTIIQKNSKEELFPTSMNLLSTYENIETSLKQFYFEKTLIPLLIHQHFMDKIINYEYKLKKNKNQHILNNIVKNIALSISYGDIIDNYIYNEQKWNLTNLYGYFSCILPSYYLSGIPNCKIQLKFPIDMNKTSIQKINTKQIFSMNEIFNFIKIEYYLMLAHLINNIILNIQFDEIGKKNHIETTKNIYQKKLNDFCIYYKLNSEKIEKILKIDKINNIENNLLKKNKKILELIFKKI